eukprot:jgi/Chrzof1/9405/Cz04g01230.t1
MQCCCNVSCPGGGELLFGLRLSPPADDMGLNPQSGPAHTKHEGDFASCTMGKGITGRIVHMPSCPVAVVWPKRPCKSTTTTSSGVSGS